MVKPLSLIPFSLLLPQVFSHSFIIALDGANGVQSAGFGTRLTTRGQVHQYTGIITDKEIKAGTVGPCGRIFGGDNFPPFVIDPRAELARAESSGISTVHRDGSIVMGMFVHNPDGSGPFQCDYSSDASLSNFQPMNITVQVEGVDGVNPAAHNYVYPLTAAFYPNTTCTGGKDKDTCIVRCRNQLGFGSCAALKLGEAAKRPKPTPPANTTTTHTEVVQRTAANATAPKNLTNNVAPHPNDPVTPINPPKAPVQAPAPSPASPPSPDLNPMANLPTPHDPNSNGSGAIIPQVPAAVERRSLPKTKRLFLHKRPRRHF